MSRHQPRKNLIKLLISLASLCLAAVIIIGSIKLWQHVHQPFTANQAASQTFQTATACPISFLKPSPSQTNSWKLYPKNTSQNPPANAKLFPAEVGDLYGPHTLNSSNLAAVDVQCATSNQTLNQLINSYRQALQQTDQSANPFSHQQVINKWDHPTAMLSLPNTDPKLPNNTVYLVATGHHAYLIQAVTLSNTPKEIVNQTAHILDQLKLDQ